MRAIVFDRLQLIEFVLAQAFSAQICDAETKADENDNSQCRDDESAAGRAHAFVNEKLRSGFSRDDRFCGCRHEIYDCSKGKLIRSSGLRKNAGHDRGQQKGQGYTVREPHVKNREALCESGLRGGAILRPEDRTKEGKNDPRASPERRRQERLLRVLSGGARGRFSSSFFVCGSVLEYELPVA